MSGTRTRGFRKNAILNRAIATSEAEFLVFIDGDVLVRPDFVGRHLELARPDRWSSGSLIRLDAAATAAVTEALVASGRVFERDWLKANRAIDRFGTWLKTRPLPSPLLAALDRVTPVQKAWGGANSSAFRAAILKVNGFDESMQYGGEDKDLGVRLTNSGVSGPAPALHGVGRASRPCARLCRPGGHPGEQGAGAAGAPVGEDVDGGRDRQGRDREGGGVTRAGKGVLYVATGAAHTAAARASAASVRATNPWLGVAIYTDQAIAGPEFDSVAPVAAPHIRAKVDYLPETPFAETLYLDTDTRVLGDLGDLFRLLERFDLALAQRAHVPASPAPAVWRHAVPSSFPAGQRRCPALPLLAGGAGLHGGVAGRLCRGGVQGRPDHAAGAALGRATSASRCCRGASTPAATPGCTTGSPARRGR